MTCQLFGKSVLELPPLPDLFTTIPAARAATGMQLKENTLALPIDAADPRIAAQARVALPIGHAEGAILTF